jgi:hypothetical protein
LTCNRPGQELGVAVNYQVRSGEQAIPDVSHDHHVLVKRSLIRAKSRLVVILALGSSTNLDSCAGRLRESAVSAERGRLEQPFHEIRQQHVVKVVMADLQEVARHVNAFADELAV